LTGALLLAALNFNASPSIAGSLAAVPTQQTQPTQTQQPAVPSGATLPAETPATPAAPREAAAPALAASAAPPALAAPAANPANPANPATPASAVPSAPSAPPASPSTPAAAAPAERFTATAYALRGRTASGAHVRRGFIAADRRVLPLGSRVRLEAGPYSGEYVVADRGGAVRGRIIDIWVPTTSEAMRFGRRPVKLTVLSYGPRHAARPAKKRG
jgi:3D (Asp-Asp-Asp) domain-containing protein